MYSDYSWFEVMIGCLLSQGTRSISDHDREVITKGFDHKEGLRSNIDYLL